MSDDESNGRRAAFHPTETLKNYAKDLEDVISASDRMQELGRDLTDRQKDVYYLKRIKDREPKLKEKAETMTRQIHVEAHRLEEVNGDEKVAKALRDDLGDLVNDRVPEDKLKDAKDKVKTIQKKFLEHLGWPVDMLQPQLRETFLRYVQDKGDSVMPSDQYLTDNEDCREVLISYGVAVHGTGTGWEAGEVADLLVQLQQDRSAANSDAKELKRQLDANVDSWATEKTELETQLTGERTELSRHRESALDWKQKHDALVDENAALSDLRAKNDSLAEELENLRMKSEQEQQENDEDATQVVREMTEQQEELLSEMDKLKSSLKQEQDKISALQSSPIDATSVSDEVTSLKAEVESAKQVNAEKQAAINEHNKTEAHFRSLTTHLMESRLGTVAEVKPSLFKPFLISEKIEGSYGRIAGEETKPGMSFVHKYADFTVADPTSGFLEVMASALGWQVKRPEDPVLEALALEKAVLPQLVIDHSEELIALIYRLCQSMAVRGQYDGFTFAILCLALETLHRRYPYKNPQDWDTDIGGMLNQRYKSLPVFEDSPFIEQIAAFRLSGTLSNPASIERFFRDIEKIDNGDVDLTMTIPDMAATYRKKDSREVAHFNDGHTEVVVVRHNSDDYLFWKTPVQGWTFSKGGMEVKVEGGDKVKTFICEPKSTLATGFRISLEEEAPLTRYLNHWQKALMNAAFTIHCKQILDDLADPDDL